MVLLWVRSLSSCSSIHPQNVCWAWKEVKVSRHECCLACETVRTWASGQSELQPWSWCGDPYTIAMLPFLVLAAWSNRGQQHLPLLVSGRESFKKQPWQLTRQKVKCRASYTAAVDLVQIPAAFANLWSFQIRKNLHNLPCFATLNASCRIESPTGSQPFPCILKGISIQPSFMRIYLIMSSLVLFIVLQQVPLSSTFCTAYAFGLSTLCLDESKRIMISQYICLCASWFDIWK